MDVQNKVILLVEDDELDVISVQRSLKKTMIDYTLHVAYNGRAALEMLTREEGNIIPDVILLDLNMPKMNGIEFLAALRLNEKFNEMKIFVMTTSAESRDRKRAEELGVSGFIIKPLNYTDNGRRADSMDAFTQFHLRRILEM